MPVLFDLLKNESHPAVRAVLGHFFFVFIHPYMDGNGRMGRFILNDMLASERGGGITGRLSLWDEGKSIWKPWRKQV